MFNDGSLPLFDIAPGASSPRLRLDSDGANYHCTIYGGMVGSIGKWGSSCTPPPCEEKPKDAPRNGALAESARLLQRAPDREQ